MQSSFSTKSLWDSQVIHKPLRQQNMFIWQAIYKLKDGTWGNRWAYQKHVNSWPLHQLRILFIERGRKKESYGILRVDELPEKPPWNTLATWLISESGVSQSESFSSWYFIHSESCLEDIWEHQLFERHISATKQNSAKLQPTEIPNILTKLQPMSDYPIGSSRSPMF